jgi:hypothetical protein
MRTSYNHIVSATELTREFTANCQPGTSYLGDSLYPMRRLPTRLNCHSERGYNPWTYAIIGGNRE